VAGSQLISLRIVRALFRNPSVTTRFTTHSRLFGDLPLQAVIVQQRLKKLAPEEGLEPSTPRLTAACSTIELLWSPNGRELYKSPASPSNAFNHHQGTTRENIVPAKGHGKLPPAIVPPKFRAFPRRTAHSTKLRMSSCAGSSRPAYMNGPSQNLVAPYCMRSNRWTNSRYQLGKRSVNFSSRSGTQTPSRCLSGTVACCRGHWSARIIPAAASWHETIFAVRFSSGRTTSRGGAWEFFGREA
jgi:hypothetical protein